MLTHICNKYKIINGEVQGQLLIAYRLKCFKTNIAINQDYSWKHFQNLFPVGFYNFIYDGL
jgi:hypothetical protein